MNKILVVLISIFMPLSAYANFNPTPKQQIGICKEATLDIVNTINNIPVLQTYHVKVVSYSKASFLSFNAKEHKLRCKIKVIFSDTESDTFVGALFPSKLNPGDIMVLVKEYSGM